jgi:carbonic anhydrase
MRTFTGADVKEAIQKETGIRPPFAMDAFSDLKGDVRQSIVHINASPLVVHKDAIRGFVYEVETGRLREVK